MARLLEQKQRTAPPPSAPSVRCLIHHQVTQFLPAMVEVRPLGLQASTCSHQPRRYFITLALAPEVSVVFISLFWYRLLSGAALQQVHLLYLPHPGPKATVEREQVKKTRAFVKLDYSSLGLGKGKLSYKLINLLPNSSVSFLDPSGFSCPYLIFPQTSPG